MDEDETEPPVSPGVGKPSAALRALAVFLRLNPDLLEVAAERSSPQPKRDPSSAEFAAWLRTVQEGDKDGWLL